jgi:hypothetical protein
MQQRVRPLTAAVSQGGKDAGGMQNANTWRKCTPLTLVQEPQRPLVPFHGLAPRTPAHRPTRSARAAAQAVHCMLAAHKLKMVDPGEALGPGKPMRS